MNSGLKRANMYAANAVMQDEFRSTATTTLKNVFLRQGDGNRVFV